MPMQRDLYPSDWEEIAFAKKNSTDWKCEYCGKQCRRPDENPINFMERIQSARISECSVVEEYLEHPRRWTLTVAHLDQNPGNNAPENLAALCAPCHLKHDAPYRVANGQRKKERRGQLNLLQPVLQSHPAGHGKDPAQIQPPLTLE